MFLLLQKQYKFFLMLFILFLFSTFFWWYFFGVFSLVNDGAQYHELALSMLNDGGFSINGEISMMREPGYPFFIYLIYQFFGVSILTVCIFQAIMHFIIALLTYYIADKIFYRKVAMISALLVVLFPIFNIYSSNLLSEILACLMVMLFILVFYLAEKENKYIFYLMLSFILGALALIKSMFLLLAFPVLLLIIFSKVKEKTTLNFKKIIVFFIVFIVFVSPWIIRNYINFNQVSLSSRAGSLTYPRALKNLYSFDRSMKYIISAFSGEYIVRRFIDNEFVFEKSYIDSESSKKFKAENIKKTDNMNYDKLDALMVEASKDLIIKHPFKYALFGLVEINNLNSPMIYYTRHFSIFHDNIYNNTFAKILSILIMRLVWLIFLSMVVYSIANIAVKRKKNAYIFVLMVLYVNGILFFLQGNPRFLIPIFPIYLILASFGFCKVINKCHIKLLKKIC